MSNVTSTPQAIWASPPVRDYEADFQRTDQLFGAPSADILKIFQREPAGLRVLDIGCGQGRDALALAQLGHPVHGVDLAPTGIAQMLAQAEKLGLAELVTGQVADIRALACHDRYDAILFDRTLHMLGAEERLETFSRLVKERGQTRLIVIADERRNIAQLAQALVELDPRFDLTPVKPSLLVARRNCVS